MFRSVILVEQSQYKYFNFRIQISLWQFSVKLQAGVLSVYCPVPGHLESSGVKLISGKQISESLSLVFGSRLVLVVVLIQPLPTTNTTHYLLTSLFLMEAMKLIKERKSVRTQLNVNNIQVLIAVQLQFNVFIST